MLIATVCSIVLICRFVERQIIFQNADFSMRRDRECLSPLRWLTLRRRMRLLLQQDICGLLSPRSKAVLSFLNESQSATFYLHAWYNEFTFWVNSLYQIILEFSRVYLALWTCDFQRNPLSFDQFRQPLALVPRIALRRVGVAEPGQRRGDELVSGYLAVTGDNSGSGHGVPRLGGWVSD